MDQENLNLTEFPEKNTSDLIYQIILILLGIGGQIAGKVLVAPADLPLSALLTSSIDPPVIERRNRWLKQVAEKLESTVSDVKVLNKMLSTDSERFISLLMHALPIAVKNHQKEKLESLANIVINSYTSKIINEDIEFALLSIVDKVTPSHIYVLQTFDWKWKRENTLHTSNGEIVKFDETYPKFKSDEQFFYWIVKDLINLNLLHNDIGNPTFGSGPLWRYDEERGYHTASQELLLQEARSRRESIKEELERKNKIDISNLKVSKMGEKFLSYISDKNERK